MKRKILENNQLPEDIRQVQGQVVDLALTALLVLGLPGLIVALTDAARSGWRPNAYAQVAAYAVVLVAGACRGRLPFAVRSGLLFAAGFVVGLGELLTWGMAGSGATHFILVSVFAVILLGVRMGLALAALGAVAAAVVGVGGAYGWLAVSHEGASWSTHVASYAATALLLVFALGKVHAGLSGAIAGLRDRSARLVAEVNERTRAERQVRSLNEELEERVRIRTQKVRMLSKAVEHTPVSVVITDAEGIIEFTNDAFTRSCGYTRDEAIGATPRILHSGKTPKQVITDLWDNLLAGREWHGEFHNRKKDGEEFIEEAWISPLCDEKGRIEKFVAVKLDITTRRELETLLKRMSRTDALTNLANRRAFDEVLAREVNRAKRTGQPLSLLLLDVDHFKRYNDTYGHQAGDHALQRVAAVLTASARRGGDVSARYGGEEFAVIMADTGAADAMVLAEGIRRNVAALGIPHESSDTAACITVSVGVATLDSRESSDSSRLIELADRALYSAKAAGRNVVRAESLIPVHPQGR